MALRTTQIADAIAELNEQDTAFIVIEAIKRLGEHGRAAGELLKGQVEGLHADDRMNVEEGFSWLQDEMNG